VQEEENEVDLSLLPEKEKNKILNQRTRDAKKAMDKADREATRAAAKALRETTAAAAKEARKTGKFKIQFSPLHLTETSIASLS
jgi:serine/threonine protein kinase HipA of HipAB toxin-antitoxin module